MASNWYRHLTYIFVSCNQQLRLQDLIVECLLFLLFGELILKHFYVLHNFWGVSFGWRALFYLDAFLVISIDYLWIVKFSLSIVTPITLLDHLNYVVNVVFLTISGWTNIVSCVNPTETLVWWLFWRYDCLFVSVVDCWWRSWFYLDDDSWNFVVFFQLMTLFSLVRIELLSWYHPGFWP